MMGLKKKKKKKKKMEEEEEEETTTTTTTTKTTTTTTTNKQKYLLRRERVYPSFNQKQSAAGSVKHCYNFVFTVSQNCLRVKFAEVSKAILHSHEEIFCTLT